MRVQRKVLHLSLLVAMALPPLAASAASDEAAQNLLGQQAQTATQAAAGQAEAQALQNAGESQRLRQRINEAVNEKAVRSRQEKHEDKSDAEQDQTQLQTGDRDRLSDQDMLQTRDPDRLPGQDKLQTRDRIRDQDRLMDPYGFDYHSAGQGFNSDASMYQRRGGDSVKGAGITSTDSRSGGAAGRGGGRR